jgi:hypothetical protein
VPVSIARGRDVRLSLHYGAGAYQLLQRLDGIEAHRLAVCQVCGHFFYAKRIQPDGPAPGACSPNCALSSPAPQPP